VECPVREPNCASPSPTVPIFSLAASSSLVFKLSLSVVKRPRRKNAVPERLEAVREFGRVSHSMCPFVVGDGSVKMEKRAVGISVGSIPHRLDLHIEIRRTEIWIQLAVCSWSNVRRPIPAFSVPEGTQFSVKENGYSYKMVLQLTDVRVL
jgi:hypothetical protein